MGRNSQHQLARSNDLCTVSHDFFASAVVHREESLSPELGAAASGLAPTEQEQEQQVKQDDENNAVAAQEQKLGVVGVDGAGKQSERVSGSAEQGDGMSRWTCMTCDSVFLSLEQQRSHFKSDFHRLNVKRKGHGKAGLSEEEFEIFAQSEHQRDNDDVSSISGSDTDDSEDEGERKPRLGVNRRVHISFLLQNSGQVVSVWRAVLVTEKEVLQGEKGYADDDPDGLSVSDGELERRLRVLKGPEPQQVWVVLLANGGHFAGVVGNIVRGEVLAHQTFHRYVVRAKAGGRQSTKDASGRAPKSAGASLRRYNEKALQKDIQDLLSRWKSYLREASIIYVHAPSSDSQSIFGGEDAALSRSDRRVRNIPFTTRRSTFKEARRVFQMLTSLEYKGPSSLEGGTKTEKVEAVSKKKVTLKVGTGADKPGQVSGREAEQSETRKDGELQETADLSDQSLSALHEAAKSGNTDSVLQLLRSGADPCAKEGRGRTPYSLAANKETRNVFRRFMAEYPDMWDWHAANVPSPLTDEIEAAQAAKQAEKDAKRKAKMKELKKQKKAQEAAQAEAKAAAELAAAATKEVRHGAGKDKRIAAQKPVAFDQALLKAQALEREMRAAAAERRLRALGLNTAGGSGGSQPQSSSSGVSDPCSYCGISLSGKVPFTRYSYSYCSTACAQVHRKHLEEE